MKNRLKCRQGMTMVEMMIVVGVIGILSSIATMTYWKFSARARQAEARLLLSGIHTAQETFFAAQGSYTSCLVATGFQRTGDGFYYAMGLASDGVNCGPQGTDDCHAGDYVYPHPCPAGAFPAGAVYVADKSKNGPPVNRIRFNANTTTLISQTEFVISAVGSISSLSGDPYDVWTIDHAKRMENKQVGY